MLDEPTIPDFALPLAKELDDLSDASRLVPFSQFATDREIGYGRDGPIILASSSGEPSRLFALKETRLEPPDPQDDKQLHRLHFLAIREFAIHRSLSILAAGADPEEQEDAGHVARAEAIVAGGGEAPMRELYLAVEYCPLTLAGVLDDCSDLGVDLGVANAKHLFRQLLRGLAWVHGRGVLHRDLSAGNVLLTEEGGLKLADFGEARACRVRYGERDGHAAAAEAMTRRRTALWWCAPEVCLGSDAYDFAADVWAAGCLLAEMLLLEPLFQGDGDLHMLHLMARVLGPPSDAAVRALGLHDPLDFAAWRASSAERPVDAASTLPFKFDKHGGPDTVEMLRALLQWDSGSRPTAEQALAGSRQDAVERHSPFAGFKPHTWWQKIPRAEDETFAQDNALRDVMRKDGDVRTKF